MAKRKATGGSQTQQAKYRKAMAETRRMQAEADKAKEPAPKKEDAP